MQQLLFNFWGELKDKRNEALYLKNGQVDFIKRNRLAIIVAGIGFSLVAISDFMKLGVTENTIITTLIRSSYFILSISLFFYFKKKRSLKKLYTLTFIWSLAFSFMINALIYFLNPDQKLDLIDEFSAPICTLMYYIFLQLPLVLLVVGGLTTTIIYLLMVLLYVKTSIDGFFILTILLIIINFLGFYITRSQGKLRRIEFLNTKTINDLNKTLKTEIEEKTIAQQKLENVYIEITDSVKYARQIQLAMLPEDKLIVEDFKDVFIIHRPLDILSGDFYWYSKDSDLSHIAVADCTGHGVPGALMSMLGISSLNEIVKTKRVVQPNEILNQLRNDIITSLHQTDKDLISRDGMDIALCCINKMERKIYFTGAFNHLYLIRNGVLIEYKGDKMPIGYFVGKIEAFSLHEIDIVDGDTIFMTTDGIIDQFGGSDGKRFSTRRLKQLLTDVAKYPFAQQKSCIETHLHQWMGASPQIDDMLIIGIKINI